MKKRFFVFIFIFFSILANGEDTQNMVEIELQSIVANKFVGDGTVELGVAGVHCNSALCGWHE